MGLLKKRIKATTLMETLVATSIILIIFVIASLVLNNVFKSITLRDTFSVSNRIEKLMYLYQNDKLSLPYDELTKDYELSIEQVNIGNIRYVQIDYKSKSRQNIRSKFIIDEK
ncbi:hypothetical protein [Dokdonia sp. MED134]|uniref:hypothetical protein n=1 Tax=Dokdonia sp. MED134 TaxID=313590 RepID=UPI000068CF73|nr:hypothetical protein [Dokdonia sp. MED134]